MYLSYLSVRLTQALGRDGGALTGARDGSWPALTAGRGDIEQAAVQARAQRHARAVARVTGG